MTRRQIPTWFVVLVMLPMLGFVLWALLQGGEEEIPRCTEAIADAGGICQGVPTWETP